jgi:hypothetical protein
MEQAVSNSLAACGNIGGLEAFEAVSKAAAEAPVGADTSLPGPGNRAGWWRFGNSTVVAWLAKRGFWDWGSIRNLGASGVAAYGKADILELAQKNLSADFFRTFVRQFFSHAVRSNRYELCRDVQRRFPHYNLSNILNEGLYPGFRPRREMLRLAGFNPVDASLWESTTGEMESMFIRSNRVDLLKMMWTGMKLEEQRMGSLDHRFDGNISMSDEWYAPLQTALQYRAFDSFRFYADKLDEAMVEKSIERLTLDWTHAVINGDWWFIKEEWGDNEESCMWEWYVESQVLTRDRRVSVHMLFYAASYGMEKLEWLFENILEEDSLRENREDGRVLGVFLVAAAQNDIEKLDQYWTRFGKLVKPHQRAPLCRIVSSMGCVEASAWMEAHMGESNYPHADQARSLP